MRTPPLLRLLRPHQWYKNLIVLVPLVFSNNALSYHLWPAAGLALAAFFLLSGAAYAWNDALDADRDRAHPRKRARPVAAGAVSAPTAIALGAVAAAAGLALLWRTNAPTLLLGAAFVVLQLAYNLVLKHQVLWDVIAIGAGFVLRALAGTTAIAVGDPTVWLVLCVFLFALFLGFAKRRHELLLVNGAPGAAAGNPNSRPLLDAYTIPLLDQTTNIVATLLLTAYFLYTFFGAPTPWMMLTIPFAVYGVLRYLWLVHRRDLGEEPELIFRDRATLANALAWLAVVLAVLREWPQRLLTWLQGL